MVVVGIVGCRRRSGRSHHCYGFNSLIKRCAITLLTNRWTRAGVDLRTTIIIIIIIHYTAMFWLLRVMCALPLLYNDIFHRIILSDVNEKPPSKWTQIYLHKMRTKNMFNNFAWWCRWCGLLCGRFAWGDCIEFNRNFGRLSAQSWKWPFGYAQIQGNWCEMKK